MNHELGYRRTLTAAICGAALVTAGLPLLAEPAHITSRELPRSPEPRPYASPNDAEHVDVELALRRAPAVPRQAEGYRGRGETMVEAATVQARIARFPNYRAASINATWRENPAYEWRIRPAAQCHDELRDLGIGFVPYEVEDEETELDAFPTPAPILLRSRIEGVPIVDASGRGLMSCELAVRLVTLSRIAARHGITRVMLSSVFRPGNQPSMHTLGMAIDISWVEVEEPLLNGDGESTTRLIVARDFIETPDVETCDPRLLEEDSPLGGDERARVLLSFVCEVAASGVFATVLTPNYNAGHRGHFHMDIRPDDPRTFLR